MPTSLFDRVSGLVDEIGAEKQAAAEEKKAETGIPDPGGAEGGTSHPSKKTDDDLQPSSEGFQSADNERIVKDQIPDAVDTKSEATEGNAPKATDTQQGQGVDEAKPTGEDSSTEGDYKGKLEGDKREGDQGGTSHPAKGDYGEKYSADAVAKMTTETLLKSAATIGDEILADIANGQFSPASPAPSKPTETAQAAADGEKTAEQAGEAGDRLEDIASGVVQEIVKTAYQQADLVTDHLAKELSILKKAHGEADDPTGGAVEGEAFGSDPNVPPGAGVAPGANGEEMPEGAEALLAAMGGGGPDEGGEEVPPGAGGVGAEELGGIPPELGAEGGPPEEMGGMDEMAALQELVMAMEEAGITPEQLVAMAQPEGQKIASAVHNHKRSGNFCFTEAKQGSAERKVRDYMKGFVLELYNRSQK